MKNKTFNRQKIVIVFFACLFIFLLLLGRLTWLMVADSVYYTEKASRRRGEGFWMLVERSLRTIKQCAPFL